jgi:hypothetical protein
MTNRSNNYYIISIQMSEEDKQFEDPKKTNPLDKLEKSATSLDSLKRGYNDHKKTDSKFFTQESFLKDFDQKGFSIYQASYKYNDDFTGRPDFVNRNAVNGFVQNLDDARKYAFGSFILVDMGKDVKHLTSYWILRGQEPIKDVFDSFLDDNVWVKLDVNEETCKLLDTVFYGDTLHNNTIEHRSIFL